MSAEKTNLPRPLDKKFLKSLKVGDRLFHYPNQGDVKSSFDESAPAKYTLYSVIDLPTNDEVTVLGSFDQQGKKKVISREELLNGEWWHSADR
jgi:hypothetical protein